MGLIPEEIISQILDRCDIVETIASYIPLKKAGRNFKALCPFHNEKTPSFVVNPEKQIFHCFGCHVGGNVITFVMKQENTTFPEAARMLAGKVGITIPSTVSTGERRSNQRDLIFEINAIASEYYHEKLLKGKDPSARRARQYLQRRGLNLETVKAFRLGYASERWDELLGYLRKKNFSLGLIEKAGLIIPQKDKSGYYDRFRNRIIFPIFDVRGRCRAFGGRTLGNDSAKYINSPETDIYTKGKHLYGLHVARDVICKNDSIVIAEGYMDALLPFQSGVQNIVASLGTALTLDQIRLICRYTKNVILLFDTDKAGESAAIRSLDLLLEEGCFVRVATLVKGEDPDSFIRKYGITEFRNRIKEARSFFDFRLGTLEERFNPHTIEGKAHIAQQMLPTISLIPNAIVRDEYIRKLSQAIEVSEAALTVELKKITKEKISPANKGIEKGIPLAKMRAVEKDLLRLMLREQEIIAAVKEEVHIEDFRDEAIRRIVEEIYNFVEEGRKINVNALMSRFGEPEIVQLLAQLVSSDVVIENVEKAQRDYIKRMIKDRLAWQKKSLEKELKEAQRLGDDKKVFELLGKINEIIRVK